MLYLTDKSLINIATDNYAPNATCKTQYLTCIIEENYRDRFLYRNNMVETKNIRNLCM